VVAGIGGPLVLAICNALVNFTPGWAQAATTEEMVEVSRAHAGLTQAIVATGLLAIALIVPGVWAVAARLAPRTPVLAGIGAWAMATGYVFGLALSTDTLQRLLVSQSGLDVSEYGAEMDAQVSWLNIVIFSVFGFGALVGAVILAIAIIRQHGAFPAWAGWLLLAAEPIRIAGLSLGLPFGPPLASVLITAAFAGVLLRRSRPAAIAPLSA
jgi:hypothetical protein